MSRCDDAYGHLICDFHSGKHPQEIIEREDGFIDTSSGPATYFAEYQDWPQEQQRTVDLAHGRILDIGCGAGTVYAGIIGKRYVQKEKCI